MQRFNQPVQQIAVLWTNLQSAVAGAERIFGLLDTVPDVQDKPDAPSHAADPGPGRVRPACDAAYKEDEPVLCDVSFVAEPGQTVAIVGPTGAGKTTIINLIPRFYDVTDGRGAHRRARRARRDACQPARARSASCCRTPTCSATR